MYNKEISKKYYQTQKGKDAYARASKKYYEKNKEKIIEHNRIAYYKYRQDYQRMKMYGMSEQDYLDMYNEQEGCCLICHRYYDRLCIDHCHSKGVVRGLLCYRCNIMLGHAHDDILLLTNAIIYLNNH